MARLKSGDEVTWGWGEGTASGVIVESFTSKVTKVIKGTEVKRNATEHEPAFLIEQSNGDRVLKSVTEIERT